jgi:hypothetical protein
MEAIFAVLLLTAVVAFVSAPLRRDPASRSSAEPDSGALAATKDAKLREILDTELDYRTGKLSDRDYEETDQLLRAEAIELTRRREEKEDAP